MRRLVMTGALYVLAALCPALAQAQRPPGGGVDAPAVHPPEDARYVASSRGQVFYWVGCGGWRSLSPRNLRFFRSRAAAVSAGYRPSRAAGCDPARAEDGGPGSASESCVIAAITDGDTVRCETGERVRLLLIDAPEARHADYGLRARLALEELAPVGTAVRLETDVQPRDRYGRLLAHLHAPGGAWLNREMARRGYALVTVYPPNVRHVEAIRAAADSARVEGAGLWAGDGFDCEPADYRRGRCR